MSKFLHQDDDNVDDDKPDVFFENSRAKKYRLFFT